MGTENSRFAEHGEDTSSPHAHGLACDYEYRIPVPGDPVEGTAHQDDEINTIPTRVSTPNNVDIRKAHHFIRLVDWEYGLGIRRAFEHSLWHEDFYVDETETIYGIWSDLCDVASCQMRRWERTSFSWEALSSDTQEELSRWSPKAKEYFEDPERAHWILLARFYHTLDERLFSADTAVKWNRSEGVNSHLAQVTDFFRSKPKPILFKPPPSFLSASRNLFSVPSTSSPANQDLTQRSTASPGNAIATAGYTMPGGPSRNYSWTSLLTAAFTGGQWARPSTMWSL